MRSLEADGATQNETAAAAEPAWRTKRVRDVVIVGGGVIGWAIARELSRFRLDTAGPGSSLRHVAPLHRAHPGELVVPAEMIMFRIKPDLLDRFHGDTLRIDIHPGVAA